MKIYVYFQTKAYYITNDTSSFLKSDAIVDYKMLLILKKSEVFIKHLKDRKLTSANDITLFLMLESIRLEDCDTFVMCYEMLTEALKRKYLIFILDNLNVLTCENEKLFISSYDTLRKILSFEDKKQLLKRSSSKTLSLRILEDESFGESEIYLLLTTLIEDKKLDSSFCIRLIDTKWFINFARKTSTRKLLEVLSGFVETFDKPSHISKNIWSPRPLPGFRTYKFSLDMTLCDSSLRSRIYLKLLELGFENTILQDQILSIVNLTKADIQIYKELLLSTGETFFLYNIDKEKNYSQKEIIAILYDWIYQYQ